MSTMSQGNVKCLCYEIRFRHHIRFVASSYRLFPTECGRLLSDFLDSGVESELQ